MFVRNYLIGVMLSGLFWAGCSDKSNTANGQSVTLQVTSTAITQGQPIPSKYTCSGADISPPLAWSSPPAGVKSIAVIADDTDAPGGTFTHWALFNLPPDTVEMAENVPQMQTLPSGAKQGVNDFGKTGYSGPCPPPGKPHHYHFKVYALDEELNLPAAPKPGEDGTPNATGKTLAAAIRNHIVAESELMCTFGRPAAP